MNHVGLVVANLDEALRFYVEVLGMTVIKRVAGDMSGDKVGLPGMEVSLRLALLDAGDSKVEVIEYLTPRGSTSRRASDEGLGHIAFEVTDIHAAVTYLLEEGVRFETAVIADEPGRYWVYGVDPFGIVLELVQESI